MSFAATWMDREAVTLNEADQTERQVSRGIAHMWNLKKWYERIY